MYSTTTSPTCPRPMSTASAARDAPGRDGQALRLLLGGGTAAAERHPQTDRAGTRPGFRGTGSRTKQPEKPAGKKPDAAQTGGQKQAEEKRAAQKQPAQSQAGQRPGRRKPQGQAPGDPKPQGQRTGGKQTPDGQQPQDKGTAARPTRRRSRNRNRGGQKPDGQNAAAANPGRGQDGRKSGSQKPARDKRETGSPEAPRKTQAPEKKKSGMGSWLSGILRPGRK